MMNAYDSLLKRGKAQLNINQNGEELICFYPHMLKNAIENSSNPNAGFRGMTFENSLKAFDPNYKRTLELNQDLAKVLKDLAKYRLLSNEEIDIIKRGYEK